jgi:hypothetical protein
MNPADSRPVRMLKLGQVIFFVLLCSALPLRAEGELESVDSPQADTPPKDVYTFESGEFEKKVFSGGGFGEIFSSLNWPAKSHAQYKLNYYSREPALPYGEAFFRLQPEAKIDAGIFKAFGRGFFLGGYRDDGTEWLHDEILYEGYATLMPVKSVSFDAGKKNLKWGKGYAWNPVAFADRPKNPDDPELANEGYVLLTMDLIANFNSPLQTISFSPVAIPVYEKVNQDFGKIRDWNFAGRLYLLFFDTDIDFLFLSGKSRGDKFGMDLSRNFSSSFEIHGEMAYQKDITKMYLDDRGRPQTQVPSGRSFLAGIRYLNELETTFILEYLYNDAGMTKAQMENYYKFIDKARLLYRESADDSMLIKANELTKSAYGRMNPMRQYLYLRIVQKEPRDILYFYPALTVLYNPEDQSWMLTPELLYSGWNNFEFRLRYSRPTGPAHSEFGERLADHRMDLRLRYFF